VNLDVFAVFTIVQIFVTVAVNVADCAGKAFTVAATADLVADVHPVAVTLVPA